MKVKKMSDLLQRQRLIQEIVPMKDRSFWLQRKRMNLQIEMKSWKLFKRMNYVWARPCLLRDTNRNTRRTVQQDTLASVWSCQSWSGWCDASQTRLPPAAQKTGLVFQGACPGAVPTFPPPCWSDPCPGRGTTISKKLEFQAVHPSTVLLGTIYEEIYVNFATLSKQNLKRILFEVAF